MPSRAQHLMPAQHHARATGEHVEALPQAGARPFHPQQRHPRGGELDSQRDAVQAPADLDDRVDVLRRQRETRVGDGAAAAVGAAVPISGFGGAGRAAS